jgi:hypothetical protein
MQYTQVCSPSELLNISADVYISTISVQLGEQDELFINEFGTSNSYIATRPAPLPLRNTLRFLG